MEKNNIESLQDMYADGYRCIRTEQDSGGFAMYLKNFDTEKINTLISNNDEEIQKLNRFIEMQAQAKETTVSNMKN